MNIFKKLVSIYAIRIAGCNHQGNDAISGNNNSELFIQIQAARAKLKLNDAPDTHSHESMKLGEKAIHKHACATCGKEYTHKHTKKVSGSCNYRHLCKMCVGSTPLPTCTEM